MCGSVCIRGESRVKPRRLEQPKLGLLEPPCRPQRRACDQWLIITPSRSKQRALCVITENEMHHTHS